MKSYSLLMINNIKNNMVGKKRYTGNYGDIGGKTHTKQKSCISTCMFKKWFLVVRTSEQKPNELLNVSRAQRWEGSEGSSKWQEQHEQR